jgi:hypothetical protein
MKKLVWGVDIPLDMVKNGEVYAGISYHKTRKQALDYANSKYIKDLYKKKIIKEFHKQFVLFVR